MSTDFSIRPVGAPAAQQIALPASIAASSAVETELPPSQSVTATDAATTVRNDVPTTVDPVSRQAYVDQAANTIVYQVIDSKTGNVVQQFPDEGVLRRRAYFHSLDLAKSELTRPQATDLKA